MNSLEEFECLVISNNSSSNKLENQVFWFKANLRNNFHKMGCKQFWDYHNNNYDENYQKNELQNIGPNFRKDINNFTKDTNKKYSVNISKVDI